MTIKGQQVPEIWKFRYPRCCPFHMQALLTLNDAFGMVFVNLVFKFLKRRSQFKGELLQKDFTDRRRKR